MYGNKETEFISSIANERLIKVVRSGSIKIIMEMLINVLAYQYVLHSEKELSLSYKTTAWHIYRLMQYIYTL